MAFFIKDMFFSKWDRPFKCMPFVEAALREAEAAIKSENLSYRVKRVKETYQEAVSEYYRDQYREEVQETETAYYEYAASKCLSTVSIDDNPFWKQGFEAISKQLVSNMLNNIQALRDKDFEVFLEKYKLDVIDSCKEFDRLQKVSI
jgi:hypothetical protein